MKYKELLSEMPYLHRGSMALTKQTTYSGEALIRDFDFLFTYYFSSVGSIRVCMHKHTNKIVGMETNRNAQDRYNCVFALLFKDQVTFSYDLSKDGIHGKILQVDHVELHHRYQLTGFASSIYQELVDNGMVIVSDGTQYEPAKGMWKKLAKSNYDVIVFDCDYGPFKDENGKIIRYDGTNMPDSDIWSEGSDYDGYNRLLCLTKF